MDKSITGRDAVPGRRDELDRRTVLRRGAIIGGALVWSTPVVQSLASPAFAAGSPLCETRVVDEDCTRVYENTPDCCECIESYPELPLADALARCADEGKCVQIGVDVCGKEEEKPPPNPPPGQEVPPPGQEVPPPTVAGQQASAPTVGGKQASVPTVIPAGS